MTVLALWPGVYIMLKWATESPLFFLVDPLWDIVKVKVAKFKCNSKETLKSKIVET